jgi:predicted RNase H-like HicB family nuclease
MNTITDQYLKRPYTKILIENDDGTYSAEILEFSGCFADGNTPNDAMANLNNAAESWIEVCIDQGLDIPEPLDNQDFSGRIALRIPRSLHKQAIRFAKREGISLNQFLVSAIAEKLGAEAASARQFHIEKKSIPILMHGNEPKLIYFFSYKKHLVTNKYLQIADEITHYTPDYLSTEAK